MDSTPIYMPKTPGAVILKRPIKAARCPFCGRRPSGKRFCSTASGPALMCVCGAQGPPALAQDEEYIFLEGAAERRLEQKAVERWNGRCRT